MLNLLRRKWAFLFAEFIGQVEIIGGTEVELLKRLLIQSRSFSIANIFKLSFCLSATEILLLNSQI